VCDTGIGIPEDRLHQLFQPFTQADASTTRRFGGTGLGLAICRQLADAMGGAIDVTSHHGQGSCFHVTLPLAAEPMHEPAPAPDYPGIDGMNVIVVAPSDALRVMVADELGHAGARVSTRGAWDEAAPEQPQAQPWQLVLLAPDAGSMRAAASLAGASAPDAPIVLLGEPRDTVPAGVRIAGALTEPLRQSELVPALANLAGVAVRRPEPESRPAPAEPAIDAAALRILLVEDNPINQKVAVRMLQRAGYACELAENGREALEALGRADYDMVFMDCQMPEMDGFAATEAIRRREGHRRRTPIVAMTAMAMKGDSERCLEAGMDDYIAKPIRREELERVLARFGA
jgi:CheY-like chemotaxis protein